MYEHAIGIGVAGNFAGHLEQAGEAGDFVGVEVADATAPKGVFPFYVPGSGAHFLHTYPISSHEIRLSPGGEKHQIEPEVALLCELTYGADGRVSAIAPRFAMAHDDCSIRREGARKISEKKNWGPASKGTSEQRISVGSLGDGGSLEGYRLASFLRRDGALDDYGVDSAVTSYSYFGQKLLDWLVDRVREQRDDGPLEDMARWLEVAGRPREALISIGATRYTDYGESHFLECGDEAIVVVYDSRRHSPAAIRAWIDAGAREAKVGVSLLCQRVVQASSSGARG